MATVPEIATDFFAFLELRDLSIDDSHLNKVRANGGFRGFKIGKRSVGMEEVDSGHFTILKPQKHVDRRILRL